MATQRQTWLFSVLLLAFALFGSGCRTTHQDITTSQQYPTDYVIGDIYCTQQGLAAQRVEHSWFRSYDTFAPALSPTLLEVQSQPERWTRNYVIVPAHTFVQIKRFDLEKNDENGIFMWIRGRVTRGPLINQELMLSFISRNTGPSALRADLLLVDTNFLERTEYK